VCDALADLSDGPRTHFLSNVDGHAIARLLPRLDPVTTLAIVSSKSLSTRETLLNAQAVRAWLEAAGCRGAALAQHMVVVSAKADAATSLGLPATNQFSLWDWVGDGFRWSAIDCRECCPSVRAVDEFWQAATPWIGTRSMPARSDLPAMLALLALGTLFVLQTRLCLLPYDDRFGHGHLLQQLVMESRQSRSLNGDIAAAPTSPVIWGGGTDAQHTFFQALRQGTLRTAIDIVVVDRAQHAYPEHHRALGQRPRAG
jgi:glucose-6-phosphate isomerase